MDERRARDPDRIAVPIALVDQDGGHQGIVDRLFTRHFTRHELEFAVARVFHERGGVNEDALRAVLGFADGDQIALAEPAAFASPQAVVGSEDDRRVHARFTRHDPLTVPLHIGRKIRRGEEAVGKNAIRWSGKERRVRGAGELRGRKVRR